VDSGLIAMVGRPRRGNGNWRVTYGYIYQLKTGLRNVAQVSDEFIASSARYFNKPQLYVQALAGKLNLTDYLEPASIDGELDTAMHVTYRNEEWGCFMPLSLRNLGQKERLFLVRLYESATGKSRPTSGHQVIYFSTLISHPPQLGIDILILLRFYLFKHPSCMGVFCLLNLQAARVLMESDVQLSANSR